MADPTGAGLDLTLVNTYTPAPVSPDLTGALDPSQYNLGVTPIVDPTQFTLTDPPVIITQGSPFPEVALGPPPGGGGTPPNVGVNDVNAQSVVGNFGKVVGTLSTTVGDIVTGVRKILATPPQPARVAAQRPGLMTWATGQFGSTGGTWLVLGLVGGVLYFTVFHKRG
jgi:hypothetical protein